MEGGTSVRKFAGPARESRNEFQTLIATFLLLSGLSQVVFHQTPVGLGHLPGVLRLTWAWTLTVGSSLMLAGAFWRDEGKGLWLELAGMLGIGFLATAYGITVVTVQNPAYTFGGPLILAVALACFRRSWKIRRRIWPSRAEHEAAVEEVVRRMQADEFNRLAEGDL